MDFSGHAGRVIENPREALSAALEEAQAWRVRGCTHLHGYTGHLLSMWVSMAWEEEWGGVRQAPRCRKGLYVLEVPGDTSVTP